MWAPPAFFRFFALTPFRVYVGPTNAALGFWLASRTVLVGPSTNPKPVLWAQHRVGVTLKFSSNPENFKFLMGVRFRGSECQKGDN